MNTAAAARIWFLKFIKSSAPDVECAAGAARLIPINTKHQEKRNGSEHGSVPTEKSHAQLPVFYQQ